MRRLALLCGLVCLASSPAGAAVRGADGSAKLPFKFDVPKPGTVTVAQFTLKAAKKPRLVITNKKALSASVTVVGTVAKKAAKTWTARLVIANRAGKSTAGVAQDFGFVSVNSTLPGKVTNRGVTGSGVSSFLNVTVLGASNPPPSLCTGLAGATVLAGDVLGGYSANDVFEFGDDALCGKQEKGASVFFGTLRGVAVSPVALTAAPTSVAAGDFDGNGSADVAVTVPHGVLIFVGLGDGTFALPLSVPLAGNPVTIAAADIDLDGLTDLAIAESSPNEVEVFTGAFLAPRSIGSEVLNGSPENFTFGNANTDADVDLFVATTAGVQVLENDGKGDFSAAGNLTVPSNVPLAVAFGRIDGDPIGDVVFVGEQGAADVFGFFIFTGNGNDTFGGPFPHGSFTADHTIYGPGSEMIVLFGHSAATYASGGLRFFPNVFPTFGPEQFIPAGTRPAGVLAADVNKDNVTDLIALNRGSGTLSTDLGTPSGGFGTPKTSSPAGSNPVSAAILNFNNDAFPDIAVVNAPPGGGAGSVDILAGDGQGTFHR